MSYGSLLPPQPLKPILYNMAVMLYSGGMRTIVGVAEARAQFSEIIASAINAGTITVIERYGKPAVAVVPIDALPPEPSPSDVASSPAPPSATRERNRQLLQALREVVEISKTMTPEESEAVYEAFNAPYQESRGRPLEH